MPESKSRRENNGAADAPEKKRIVLTVAADVDLASTEDARQLASAVGSALAELLVVHDVTTSFPVC